jgi:hypothetical protein
MDKMAKISLDDKIVLGESCEAPYCKNLQTSPKAANYSLCDEHYKSLDYDCTRCDTPAFHWCVHKS